MNIIKRYNADKATVCSNKTCVTVYGEAARVINTIAVFVALILAVMYIAKALR